MSFLFFKRKTKTHDHPRFGSFEKALTSLLDEDRFLARKDYLSLMISIAKDVEEHDHLEESGMFKAWCDHNNYNSDEIEGAVLQYKTIKQLVDKHNDDFVNKHLQEDQTYLRDLVTPVDPNIKLDIEQQNVVLRDEDYTLVIAGAGTGKTTTIAAKVRYLVERKHIDPARILVVSLTRKATQELKDRINKGLRIPARISTFHSVGYALVNKEEPTKLKPVGEGFLYDSVRNFLKKQIENEDFLKKILLFFASYLTPPFSEADTKLLHRMLANNDFTTMKSDLEASLIAFKQELAKKRITLKEERVKSYEELAIANFLYINGIEYEYEPIYEYGFANSIRAYTPDFLLRQGDKKVYLEHYGITEALTSSRFSPEQLETYKTQMRQKEELHRRHHTQLIHTFSSYKDNRDLIEHLKELLVDNGFALHQRDQKEIFAQLAKNAEDKYFNRLSYLITHFISAFEIDNYPASKFAEWLGSAHDDRSRLFLEISEPCYNNYKQALREKGLIDFQDMINGAVDVLDDYIKNGKKAPFDYVFVDEYQDISLQRFDFCKKMAEASDAKILAVGDDWQSIYRFAGSNVSLFTHFKEKMGDDTDQLKITKTYRNSQELIDIAGSFVMQNRAQIQKGLRSPKSLQDPIVLLTYDDNEKKTNDFNGALHDMGETVIKAIDRILTDSPNSRSILIIGRFHFDGRNLAKSPDLFSYDETHGRIVCRKYPNVAIDFLTAHGSKGLGYDNVILVNARDALFGFPCQIEEEPLLKYVIKDEENFSYSEERRLFYVALTRTKNRVYIVTPQYHPSKFVLELKDRHKTIPLEGNELRPEEIQVSKHLCPYCGYPLQRRANKALDRVIWVCSNDPEVCGYMTNLVESGKMQICKCPKCHTGYLVAKKSEKAPGGIVMGCTNYKEDKTGCDMVLNKNTYTDRKDLLAKTGKVIFDNIEDMFWFNHQIQELVSTTFSAFREISTKKHNFGVSVRTFAGFLSGESSDFCEKTDLNHLCNYGVFKDLGCSKTILMLHRMEKFEMIAEKDDRFRTIDIKEEKASEQACRDLYSSLMSEQE